MPVDFIQYHDASLDQHRQIINTRLPEGYRVLSLSIYGDPSDPAYAGVLVRRPILIAQRWVDNLDKPSFKKVVADLGLEGFAPIILTATGSGSSLLFAAVFQAMPLGVVPRTRIDIERPELDTENVKARDRGESLRWAAMYGQGAARRFTAVWWPHPTGVAWSPAVDLDPAQDQQVFNALMTTGGRPSFGTISADGRYLAVYRDDSIGPVGAVGSMDADGLTKEVAKQKLAGFFPLCIQGGGSTRTNARFTAIFAAQEEEIPRQFTVTGTAVPELKQLDDLVQLGMKKSGTRGAVLAAARNGRLVYSRGYTWAEPGYPITQPESFFRVASCSKALTAIVIHQLIEQGRLSAGTLVQPLLGLKPPPNREFTKIGETVCADAIQVRHLLAHLSGLPHFGPTQQEVADAFQHGQTLPPTKEEYVGYALCQPFLFPPGGPVPAGADNYSNTGYLMLGLVIEAVTGLPYAKAVSSLLFGPLGIGTGFIGGAKLEQRQAGEVRYHANKLGFGPSGLVPPPQPLVAEQYGVGGHMSLGDASGTWVLTATDFARVLAALDANPSAPVFQRAETRQALWDCGMWERPVPFDNGLANGNSVTTRVKGGGFSGTGALVLHRDDGISAALYLNDDFWPADSKMSLEGRDGTWLNFQLNERLNRIPSWPERPLPPFQVWDMKSNSFSCELRIDVLDAAGNMTGSILDGGRSDPVEGLWDGRAGRLTFTRRIAGKDASSVQVYTGYLFDGEDRLAGSFEAFQGTGASARTGVFGWTAKAVRPAIQT